MTRKTIGTALAVCGIAALLLPAMASAKTKTLKGKVDRDANSKVVIKMQTNNNGLPQKVAKFKFKRVDSECGGAEVGGVIKTLTCVHRQAPKGPPTDSTRLRPTWPSHSGRGAFSIARRTKSSVG